MARLKWCMDKKSSNHPDRIVGVFKANDDCYGKGTHAGSLSREGYV